jgi:endonuclease/exonuclease/phosphatase family metal-dependent hydrolase
MNWPKLRVVISASACLVVLASTPLRAQEYTRDSRPNLFTYDELVELGAKTEMSPALAEKLHALTTTPFVNNEAYLSGVRAQALEVKPIGPSLRVAFWNIERGLELDDIELFLTDKNKFMAEMAEQRKHAEESGHRVRKVDMEKIPQEIETLKAADVWILNEVDWGVKRTEYREVVRELAETLHMNWAYGVEFLEVDSKQLGTDTFDDHEPEAARQDLLQEFKVDKDKVRALHGNAILSRYPIRSARLVPFTVGYDWYNESNIRPLESAKRKAAILIGEDLQKEVRRGQRTTLFVDLDVPEAPGHIVTVAATHLENRSKPKVRRLQMEELLKQVHDVQNPVIIGGDLNTTGSDGTPTNVENMLYKRYGSVDFWTTKGIEWTTGVGAIYSAAKTARKLSGIQYQIDPTSANIPGASPNLERGLFDMLEKYRFADGKAIDFRGVADRSSNGRTGTLADSNERGSKGFAPTFNAELIWGKVRVAKYKLDWIFVKDNIESPREAKGSFLFAPHFGRTLSDLNNCPPEPISDHSPMTADLPFHEPVGLN